MQAKHLSTRCASLLVTFIVFDVQNEPFELLMQIQFYSTTKQAKSLRISKLFVALIFTKLSELFPKVRLYCDANSIFNTHFKYSHVICHKLQTLQLLTAFGK